MGRRGTISRKAKTRPGKTTKPKRNDAPTAAHPVSSTLADLQEQVSALTHELAASREHQTATAEVLRVISSSPGELDAVFQAMLENATRICEAKFGSMYLYEGGNAFRFVAAHNAPPAFVKARARDPIVRPPADTPLGRVATTRQVSHIADMRTVPSYIAHDPFVVSAVELGVYRTVLAVPMLSENELIGSINMQRQEVRPFTDKQIELVQNFAAQAVIAIENTRLLNELRESLQQQTATAEVLGVISSSPGQLEPVFEAMLANATRLCDAKFGTLSLYDGDAFRDVALHNVPPAYTDIRLREPFRPHPKAGLAHVARTKQISHTDDLRTQPPYLERDQAVVAIADLAGARTIINVPMLKAGGLIGTISIFISKIEYSVEGKGLSEVEGTHGKNRAGLSTAIRSKLVTITSKERSAPIRYKSLCSQTKRGDQKK